MLSGGTVVNAPNLAWHGVAFGPMLTKRTGRPVRLINDLSAAAWGEFCAGSSKGATDSFTVFVGTGVGSAIIAGGALLHGSSGVAGEFGHIKVVLDGGRTCGCGQTGCLEAYMGGANLEGWMHEVGLPGHATDLEQHVATGLPRARELYDFSVDQLGLAIANQVSVLNPGVVVLGGGVLSNSPGMVARITTVIQRRATVPAGKAVRIALAQLGDNSGLVGAALLG
jgi:glucokinase